MSKCKDVNVGRSEDYKRQAIELVVSSGRSIVSVWPAGYCARSERPESGRASSSSVLLAEIRQVHRESGQRYGGPRIHAVQRMQEAVSDRVTLRWRKDQTWPKMRNSIDPLGTSSGTLSRSARSSRRSTRLAEPQWLILMAIDELDQGRDASGIAVAKKMRIHPAFVTNQTKKLENVELLARSPSLDDARFIQMSQKARGESLKRQALNATIFDGLDEAPLDYLNKRLAPIAKNSRLASQKLSIGVL